MSARPGAPGFAYDWDGDVDPEMLLYDANVDDPEWDAELARVNASGVRAASARLAYSPDQSRDESGKFGEGGGTPSVDKPEGQSDTAEDRPSTAADYAFRNAAVEGLSQEQQSAVLWEQRERYEPVDTLAAGAAQWNQEQGLPPIPEGIIDTPVDIAEAEAVATFFESATDQSGDPAVQEAYDDFIRQSDEMYDFMTKSTDEGGLGVSVDFSHETDPYASAEAQASDLRDNNHITIESGLGGSHGATMTTEQYDRFRAVHDVFGHAAVGGGFDRHGEYEAWLMHSAMYSPPGRDAMATEYHAVNSALWAGAPGTPGTGMSVLLPSPYADPPWERAALAAIGDPPPAVTPETQAVLDKIGPLGPQWANQYEPWPWHTKPTTMRARHAYSDTQERDSSGKFGQGGGGESNVLAMEARGGGFTFSLTEHSLVHEGVAVSPYPEREKVVDAASFGTHDIDAFEQANADLLSQPDHYMGAWLNPADDNVYLDVSIVSPDRSAADAVGREHGQYASYDLATGDTYPIDSGRATGSQAAAEARRGAAPEGGDPSAEAGARGRHPEGPTPTAIKRSIDRLHKQRERLGRKLLAGAEVAYAEALRRAGVKVATRARSRGTSKTVQAQARAALLSGSSLRPLLGVLGLREQDILAGSFTTYEDQAGGWMDDYRKRQLAEIIRLGLDPLDFGFDDATSITEVTQAAGVGVIVAGLMALARGRLLGGIDHIMPGEVAGAIPAKLVLDGIKVAEGRSTATLGATLDDMPTVTDLPGADTVESGLADLVAGETQYTWAHGFYGDPTSPFEPHELLDGFTTADRDTDPELANGESFPDSDYYAPGDHNGCTCEWVIESPGG